MVVIRRAAGVSTSDLCAHAISKGAPGREALSPGFLCTRRAHLSASQHLSGIVGEKMAAAVGDHVSKMDTLRLGAVEVLQLAVSNGTTIQMESCVTWKSIF